MNIALAIIFSVQNKCLYWRFQTLCFVFLQLLGYWTTWYVSGSQYQETVEHASSRSSQIAARNSALIRWLNLSTHSAYVTAYLCSVVWFGLSNCSPDYEDCFGPACRRSAEVHFLIWCPKVLLRSSPIDPIGCSLDLCTLRSWNWLLHLPTSLSAGSHMWCPLGLRSSASPHEASYGSSSCVQFLRMLLSMHTFRSGWRVLVTHFGRATGVIVLWLLPHY